MNMISITSEDFVRTENGIRWNSLILLKRLKSTGTLLKKYELWYPLLSSPNYYSKLECCYIQYNLKLLGHCS